MPVDFHRDMDRYLIGKKRKRLFSDFKSKVLNKRAVVSYKAGNKFGQLKGKLVSKVGGIRKRKQEPEKQITQDDINNLVEGKGFKIEPKEKIVHIPTAPYGQDTSAKISEEKGKMDDGGWKEVKIPSLEKKKQDLTNLEGEKIKLQEKLIRLQERGKTEKEKIVRFGEEKEQREKAESAQDRMKRLALVEEIKVLKEKERIEEDRLAELKKARRREQMDSLRGKVTDILFKKRPLKEKDMAEEVRKEVRMEAKVKEAERQRSEAKELGRPKEDVTKEQLKEGKKGIVPNISGAMERLFGKTQHPKIKPEKKEIKKIEKKKEHKPKKSFFSNFIQIKTAAEIAKEEKEMLKREEKQALKDHSQVNELFEQDKVEIKTNIPKEEQSANLSTLFPGDSVKQEVKVKGDTIELDQDYKIKVVKNQ